MERFIIAREDYSIYESDEEVLPALAEFVVEENYRHHSALNTSIPKEEVERVLKEERTLINLSRIFIARDKMGRIIGSIRLTKWDRKTKLPLETLFGLNPLDLAISADVTTFWHVGRFSISQRGISSKNFLMKTLMIYALYPIIKDGTSCLLAEVDRKLFNILGKLGIIVTQIAPSTYYLASETIPICSKSEALISFYDRNKYFIHDIYKDTLKG